MDARGWSISNTRLNLIWHWVSIGYANICFHYKFSSFTSQPPRFSVPHQIFACACLWLNHTRTPLSIIDYLIRATAASRLFIQAIISPRSNHARNNDTVHAQSPTTIRLSLLFYAHTQFIMVSEAIRWVYTSLPNSLIR